MGRLEGKLKRAAFQTMLLLIQQATEQRCFADLGPLANERFVEAYES